MKLFSKTEFKKAKNFLKRVPKILGEHAFLTILALFFLSLILGGLIFYKYCILVERAEPQIIKKQLQFEEKAYQKILEEWQEREKRFKEADLKEYPDPFRGLSSGELTK